jgi:hypothetical protein
MSIAMHVPTQAASPSELAKIVPDARVPGQPLLLEGTNTFAMAGDLWLARKASGLPLRHSP